MFFFVNFIYFLANFGLRLFNEAFYMILQLQVVQLVPNAEDLKQPILRCFAFKAKFVTKKKKKQSEGSSKPSITPFQSKGEEEPDNQSKDKQKEKPNEKLRKTEEKKKFKKKEHVSCYVIYYMHGIYFIIVCYVWFNAVNCSYMFCFYRRFLMSAHIRIDLKKIEFHMLDIKSDMREIKANQQTFIGKISDMDKNFYRSS